MIAAAQKLLQGLRNLGLPGAVVAGSFEDGSHYSAPSGRASPDLRKVGTVGMVALRNGKLWGAYQGGFVSDAIEHYTDFEQGRLLSSVQAAAVVHALLAILRDRSAPFQRATLQSNDQSGRSNWQSSSRQLKASRRSRVSQR